MKLFARLTSSELILSILAMVDPWLTNSKTSASPRLVWQLQKTKDSLQMPTLGHTPHQPRAGFRSWGRRSTRDTEWLRLAGTCGCQLVQPPAQAGPPRARLPLAFFAGSRLTWCPPATPSPFLQSSFPAGQHQEKDDCSWAESFHRGKGTSSADCRQVYGTKAHSISFYPWLRWSGWELSQFTEPPATVVRLVVSSWSGAVLPIFKNAHVAKISVHVEEQIYLLCCMLVFHYLLCIP